MQRLLAAYERAIRPFQTLRMLQLKQHILNRYYPRALDSAGTLPYGFASNVAGLEVRVSLHILRGEGFVLHHSATPNGGKFE